MSFGGGLRPRRAAAQKATAALARRVSCNTEERPELISPQDEPDRLCDVARAGNERPRVALLDTRNKLSGRLDVHQGLVNVSKSRIGQVFRDAARASTASIVVAGNHPSGDPTQGSEDVAATCAMAEVGRLLDIEVLDHGIPNSVGLVSLKVRGLGF